MLKKLIKYDLKATRVMLLLFAIALGFAVLLSIFAAVADFETVWAPIALGLLMLPTYVIIVGLIVCPVIITTVRFYKHIISNEAYLTFTLPVPRHYHIISKIITNAIWQVASVVVLIVSTLMVAITAIIARGDSDQAFIGEVDPSTDLIFDQIAPSLTVLAIVLLINLIVSLFYSPMTMFTSLSLGQVLSRKSKLLGAFVAYLVISTVTGIVSGIVMLVVSVASMSSLEHATSPAVAIDYYSVIYGIMTILELAIGIVMYLITYNCLTKRLNLE